jgi:putative nucleotidyltransferase with HDIG domain
VESNVSVRSAAIDIVARLQAAGFEAFWVGGCVRDVLLGREPGDYDIATSAKPADVEQLFPHTIAVGKQFGVILVIQDGHQFEVATFRTNGDYADGRRPSQVEFSDAQADALRRDFTVNGLFYDPIQGRTYDWVGGEADLRAGILRTIGSPEQRFAEDHLRLLRAVRFAAQLRFQIQPETLAALQRSAPKIRIVSAERIRDELLKLFRPPQAASGLTLLHESGLLEQLLPEIEAMRSCEQSLEYHPEGSVFNHVLRMLDQLPAEAPEALPWAVLLHDVGKPPTFSKDPGTGQIHFYGHERVGAEMAEDILRRLKFPRKLIDEIVQCVRYHMQFKDVPQMRTATVRRMILRPTFPLELELHRLDCLGSHGQLDIYDALVGQTQELERKPALDPPLITGADLIALGMKPGPMLGALLHQIRDKQLQEELKTPDEARAWAAAKLAA